MVKEGSVELIDFSKFLENLGCTKLVQDNNTNLIAYTISNRHRPDLVAKIYLIDKNTLAYCEFDGLTNRLYMRGEAIDLNDLENFVKAARYDIPQIYKNIFGKNKIRLKPSNLVFNKSS